MTSSLSLDKIQTDGGTQSRAAINAEVVEDYAATIRSGIDLPPATVFYDGKRYWLADGFHRNAAYRKAGAVEMPVDVQQGTKREAVLYSVGANATHGLRRTNDDKRRAVATLLKDKEWSMWSDRQIAKQCGVHHDLVGRMRGELSGGNRQIERVVKRGDSTFRMDTANIGKTGAPDDDQAEFDRQREAAVRDLPPEIQALEAAKAERRAGGNGSEEWSDADDVEELRNIVAQQAEEITDLRRTVAKYDDMAVEFERGGFENVIAGLNQRIENLNRQVERESGEKVSNLRKAEFWKRKAKEAGATDDYTVDMASGDVSRG